MGDCWNFDKIKFKTLIIFKNEIKYFIQINLVSQSLLIYNWWSLIFATNRMRVMSFKENHPLHL